MILNNFRPTSYDEHQVLVFQIYHWNIKHNVFQRFLRNSKKLFFKYFSCKGLTDSSFKNVLGKDRLYVQKTMFSSFVFTKVEYYNKWFLKNVKITFYKKGLFKNIQLTAWIRFTRWLNEKIITYCFMMILKYLYSLNNWF